MSVWGHHGLVTKDVHSGKVAVQVLFSLSGLLGIVFTCRILAITPERQHKFDRPKRQFRFFPKLFQYYTQFDLATTVGGKYHIYKLIVAEVFEVCMQLVVFFRNIDKMDNQRVVSSCVALSLNMSITPILLLSQRKWIKLDLAVINDILLDMVFLVLNTQSVALNPEFDVFTVLAVMYSGIHATSTLLKLVQFMAWTSKVKSKASVEMSASSTTQETPATAQSGGSR